ncbi:hypothetical protein HK100_002010 [Physocladia obscura]|uniref:Uncharacterized protein n=1 Tax=Physocladia obscura TaxID=109957 RepID=A0AAD5SVZ5_9FUNG|nr:hypothetical protein HK100_002010 [Physocladia obscura]
MELDGDARSSAELRSKDLPGLAVDDDDGESRSSPTSPEWSSRWRSRSNRKSRGKRENANHGKTTGNGSGSGSSSGSRCPSIVTTTDSNTALAIATQPTSKLHSVNDGGDSDGDKKVACIVLGKPGASPAFGVSVGALDSALDLRLRIARRVAASLAARSQSGDMLVLFVRLPEITTTTTLTKTTTTTTTTTRSSLSSSPTPLSSPVSSPTSTSTSCDWSLEETRRITEFAATAAAFIPDAVTRALPFVRLLEDTESMINVLAGNANASVPVLVLAAVSTLKLHNSTRPPIIPAALPPTTAPQNYPITPPLAPNANEHNATSNSSSNSTNMKKLAKRARTTTSFPNTTATPYVQNIFRRNSTNSLINSISIDTTPSAPTSPTPLPRHRSTDQSKSPITPPYSSLFTHSDIVVSPAISPSSNSISGSTKKTARTSVILHSTTPPKSTPGSGSSLATVRRAISSERESHAARTLVILDNLDKAADSRSSLRTSFDISASSAVSGTTTLSAIVASTTVTTTHVPAHLLHDYINGTHVVEPIESNTSTIATAFTSQNFVSKKSPPAIITSATSSNNKNIRLETPPNSSTIASPSVQHCKTIMSNTTTTTTITANIPSAASTTTTTTTTTATATAASAPLTGPTNSCLPSSANILSATLHQHLQSNAATVHNSAIFTASSKSAGTASTHNQPSIQLLSVHSLSDGRIRGGAKAYNTTGPVITELPDHDSGTSEESIDMPNTSRIGSWGGSSTVIYPAIETRRRNSAASFGVGGKQQQQQRNKHNLHQQQQQHGDGYWVGQDPSFVAAFNEHQGSIDEDGLAKGRPSIGVRSVISLARSDNGAYDGTGAWRSGGGISSSSNSSSSSSSSSNNTARISSASILVRARTKTRKPVVVANVRELGDFSGGGSTLSGAAMSCGSVGAAITSRGGSAGSSTIGAAGGNGSFITIGGLGTTSSSTGNGVTTTNVTTAAVLAGDGGFEAKQFLSSSRNSVGTGNVLSNTNTSFVAPSPQQTIRGARGDDDDDFGRGRGCFAFLWFGIRKQKKRK